MNEPVKRKPGEKKGKRYRPLLAAERMRRSRKRRAVLFGYKKKDGTHAEGLVDLLDICVASVKAIANDITHKDCLAACRLCIDKFVPQRELEDADAVERGERVPFEQLARENEEAEAMGDAGVYRPIRLVPLPGDVQARSGDPDSSPTEAGGALP